MDTYALREFLFRSDQFASTEPDFVDLSRRTA